jgi:hypothetical protein
MKKKKEKTIVQVKFEKCIKEGFTTTLKHLGYKKKALNYYKPFSELGHTINIERYRYNNSKEISFRLNIGIFSPEYWLHRFNYSIQKSVPDFPKEIESIIRLTIGDLKTGEDLWYKVTENTKEDDTVQTIQNDLSKYLIPFLSKCKNTQELIVYLEDSKLNTKIGSLSYQRFFMYCDLGLKEKAKKELDLLLCQDWGAPSVIESLKKMAEDYKIK